MKKRLIFAASILAVSTAAFAFPPKPERCPSAASVASGGLNNNVIAQDSDGLWAVGMMRHQYDTKEVWTFVVGRIRAASAEDAYYKATASLSSLSLRQGPYAITSITKWGCEYNNSQGYVSVAVTPSMSGASLNHVSGLVK